MTVENTALATSDETIWIERAQAGDEQAFAQLMKRHQVLVFRTALGFVHNHDDANDIAQEVFVQLYRSLGEFRGQAKLSTWLYRVAVNRSLNELRARQSRSWLHRIGDWFASDGHQLQVPGNEADPARALEQAETAQALHRAIDALPEQQRTAFVLSRFDDLSYAEIAEVMQLSVPAVESLLHRAKKGLQTKLMHLHKNS